MHRRSIRLGGWGAIAGGALAIVGLGGFLALAATAFSTAPLKAPPSRPDAALLLLALVGVLGGLSLVAAVRGLRLALRPPTWVSWLAALAGWAAAAEMTCAGLLGFYGAFVPDTPSPLSTVATTLVETGLLFVGVWTIAGAAAAWRARRLPTWLRVTGTVCGACLLASPALGPLRLVAFLTGLAWMFGLGAALLRLARADSPAPAEAG